MERGYIVFQTGFDGWAIFLRLVCFFPGLFTPPPPNLLIIILFQEDNISGTIASLTYGPQNTTMKIIYSMYRAGEVSVHRACCERATQLYSLGGGGTIWLGSRPAGVTTRCSRMVTECLFTRSMLIKMYKFTISGYVPVYVFTVSQFHADVHLVYLVFFV